MKLKGRNLEFISRIKRNGSGVECLKNVNMSIEDNTYFKLNSLSITNSTYIASEFDSYVVKKKLT